MMYQSKKVKIQSANHHPYKSLIIVTNRKKISPTRHSLFFGVIYLYVTDPFESNYLLFINGKEKVGIKELKHPKAFIDYSQTIDDVYEYLEDYNPTKKRKALIVFDNIRADMRANKTSHLSVTELLLRNKKEPTFHSFLYRNVVSMRLEI